MSRLASEAHAPGQEELRQQHTIRSVTWLTLLTSSGTLICCALPAMLVTLGAGAVLAGLVSAVPQIVWLSQHSTWIFSVAGVMLVIAGYLQWKARSLPCPLDPQLAAACMRARSLSAWVYGVSCVVYLVGLGFAFIPQLIG